MLAFGYYKLSIRYVKEKRKGSRALFDETRSFFRVFDVYAVNFE